MKRIWTLAAVAALLCAVLLCGCSSAGSAAGSSAAADPLTGQELQYPGERAAAVVIENTAASTTQWGIGSASVVLEALTEANTAPSLCLVYPSVSAVPTVGPVTLGQDVYWRLLSGQEVLPIQCGASQYTRNYLDYYNLRAVDALEVGRNAFACDEGWSSTPLWRTSGKAVSTVLDSLNLSASLSAAGAASSTAADSTAQEQPVAVVPPLLPQKASPRLPEPAAEDAAAVRIDFQQQGTTGFVYSADTGTYGMLHADGSAQLDANTGTQAAFDNLLILYSSASLRDDDRTLDYDLTFGGGLWFHGGCLWHITWTQGTDSTLAFYDADGRPLTLCSGRSYLALVSSTTGEEVQAWSSTGETLLS